MRWKIGPAGLALLDGMVILMLLIVVIPDDLDLPDAAFHRGTAPVMVHSQATSAPVTATISSTFLLPFASEGLSYLERRQTPSVHWAANFLPILLRVIRR